MIQRSFRRQRGFTLILFVVLIFPLLAAVGMMVDIGWAWRSYSMMESAVRSSALAGVSRLDTPENAIDAATSMVSYQIANHLIPVTIDSPITVDADSMNGIVRVRVRAHTPAVMMQVITGSMVAMNMISGPVLRSYPLSVAASAIREPTTPLGPPYRYRILP